ncbi:MAG TPA: sugar ABC transporter permease [Fimbriimonadaceae bacterium]|nr:sugar ABC transporter permease [Fimbriimonadaceae bacterium]
MVGVARRRAAYGWLYVAPWLIGFAVFSAGPMLVSLGLSFTKYDLHALSFAGVENYRRLFFEDPLFWKSLSVTVVYAFFAVPLGILGSLSLALLLNVNVRGQRLFRTLFYLPSIVPAVASALVWLWMLDTNHGPINRVLGFFGVAPVAWLQNERFTLAAFVLMSLWGIGGGRMIIFLAGLQGIPESYYEAARLDGAGTWKQFRNVTLPLLSPVVFFNLILGFIGAFQLFTSSYVMTNGGPNNATLFYALYLFRNFFEYFKLGKASALAWVLFVILLVVTGIQFWGSRRWVYYEGEQA